MPIIKRMSRGFRDYLDAAQDTLVAGRRERGHARRRVRAALGHAVAFPNWRSLVREQGLDDPQSVDLMCRLVTAAGKPAARR